MGIRIGVRVARCLVRAVGVLLGLSWWGLLGFCWVCRGCMVCLCGLFAGYCLGLLFLVQVGALSELGSSLGALRRS